jgi:hypothetical protein
MLKVGSHHQRFCSDCRKKTNHIQTQYMGLQCGACGDVCAIREAEVQYREAVQPSKLVLATPSTQLIDFIGTD